MVRQFVGSDSSLALQTEETGMTMYLQQSQCVCASACHAHSGWFTVEIQN